MKGGPFVYKLPPQVLSKYQQMFVMILDLTLLCLSINLLQTVNTL